MARGNSEFKWLTPVQAERHLQSQMSSRDQQQGFVAQALRNFPDLAERYQGILLKGSRESRGNVSRFTQEAERHLGALGILGAARLTDDDIRQLGPLLAREASHREDAAFHILDSRRANLPPYLRRSAVINLRHMRQYGLASQSGRIDLERIQDEKTTLARELIEPLVINSNFEDSFLGSYMQRRVLRSLYYIFTEPAGTAEEKLKRRLQREVEEDGALSPLEIVERVYHHVISTYDRFTRQPAEAFETEESMIQLMEEARLSRLRELGRSVLESGIEIIAAQEK